MSGTELSHAEVHARVQQGVRYLDVRSPAEFDAGHVPSAVNVPWAFGGLAGLTRNQEFGEQVARLFSSDTQLILGCHSGGRARQAAAELAGLGFVQLAIHSDGWAGRRDEFGRRSAGWLLAGYPAAT